MDAALVILSIDRILEPSTRESITGICLYFDSKFAKFSLLYYYYWNKCNTYIVLQGVPQKLILYLIDSDRYSRSLDQACYNWY